MSIPPYHVAVKKIFDEAERNKQMIQEQQRTKLLKQLALLGSDFEGEQTAAIGAIHRTLDASGLTMNDFIQSLDPTDTSHAYNSGFSDGFQAGVQHQRSSRTKDYQQMLAALKRKEHVLNEWSRSFVNNLYNNNWNLSAKQRAVVERMHHQFCGGQ